MGFSLVGQHVRGHMGHRSGGRLAGCCDMYCAGKVRCMKDVVAQGINARSCE